MKRGPDGFENPFKQVCGSFQLETGTARDMTQKYTSTKKQDEVGIVVVCGGYGIFVSRFFCGDVAAPITDKKKLRL